MCAVCFTGFQAIPVAAAAGRAWWVKRAAVWGSGRPVGIDDEFEPESEPEYEPEFEQAEEHLVLA